MIAELQLNKLLNPKDGHIIFIRDLDDVRKKIDYISYLSKFGYKEYVYSDTEEFVIQYESKLKQIKSGIVFTTDNQCFIPYCFREFLITISYHSIYPHIEENILKKYLNDLDLIDYSYGELLFDLSAQESENYIQNRIFSESNIADYVKYKDELILNKVKNATNSGDWETIAILNAKLEYYSALINKKRDQSEIDHHFKQYILENYGALSGEPKENSPPIITKTLDFLDTNKKIAIVVMDGMSLFDFEIISRNLPFNKISTYTTYAIIPTLTSFSRQSLFSGKFPKQFANPFSTSQEKQLFLEKTDELGYSRIHVQFGKEYELPYPQTKLFVTTILIVDELMHGEKQGRGGMLNALRTYCRNNKLTSYCDSLLEQGYEVIITSDHGNTECVGIGSFQSDIQIESKGQRCTIMKPYAKPNELIECNAICYPGYYLDPNYKYYVLDEKKAFDVKGNVSIAHGGISLEEVIIPFSIIKGD